jgi:hypothetical protein
VANAAASAVDGQAERWRRTIEAGDKAVEDLARGHFEAYAPGGGPIDAPKLP